MPKGIAKPARWLEWNFSWKAKYPIFKAIVAGFRGKVALKR